MPNQPKRTVFQKKGDPYIYLWVMGEWYCYNPSETPLGSGAMGVVYKGYNCRTSQPVAVKRVADAYSNNPMIRQRARQEASLAFRHPNLVEMIGICEYAPDAGPMFLLSNLVHGEEINKFLAKMPPGELKVEKTCGYMCDVLSALKYIHSKGVIHRDIKPSNIMIEEAGDVRLMDLGISRMNGGNKFSQYGFIGTPGYSAPEQIKRDEGSSASAINAATDIYELGITFYELLTGKNPMDSPSEAQTLANQITMPLPPSDAIPRRLMSVLLKATEKEPSRRYQTADEFQQAIRQALLPAPSPWTRLTGWLGDHVVAVATAVMVVAVCIFLLLLLIL